MLTIITFIMVLSVLVFVHELGHFFTARKFGIKAEEFGFGFPPRVWGMYKSTSGKWKQVRGSKNVEDAADTIYSLNWFPLGGFVKIKGEDGENNDSDSFASKKIWKRTIVLAAGVSMNILLAALLIIFGLMIGSPQAVDGLSNKAQVSDRKIQIVQVANDSPAQKAGLQMGDVIVNINNQRFEDSDSLQKYVNENVGKELTYEIKRGDIIRDYKVKPEIRKETGKGGIGVALEETGLVRYPWYTAVWVGLKETAILTWAIILAFYELFKGLILGHGMSADVAGPVGIAKMTGQVARMGFSYLLQFTALLSINLAIVNFLPIPALDGGRILFLIIEKIKGRPVNRNLEAIIHNIFFALLMLLVLFITFREIFGLMK